MIISLVITILILGFLIFVHELGHFIVAKKSGVRVEEFGFGYPPRIWGKKIGGTIYSLNWIPFGGFVKLFGEDVKVDKDKEKSFYFQKPSVKAKIIAAGVIANVLIGIIFYYIVLINQNFSFYIPKVFDHNFVFGEKNSYPVVSLVVEDSQAEIAGLEVYDAVLLADSISFDKAEDFIEYINQNKGKSIDLELRNLLTNKERRLTADLREEAEEGEGILGASLSEVVALQYSGIEKGFSGILHSVNVLDYSLRALGIMIKQSFAEKTIEPLAESIVGPVGMIVLVKLSLAGGLIQICSLIAMISLALALVNSLPIPAADGGRMLFIIYEAIFKKPVPEKFERNVNAVGFILIIFLGFLIIWKDISQFKNILFNL